VLHGGPTPDPFGDPFPSTRKVGMCESHPDRRVVTRGRVPGEAGIWVFVFADLMSFTGLLAVTLYTGGRQAEGFAAGREALAVWQGALNTALLVTASYALVLGLRRLQAFDPRGARSMLAVSLACAALFVVDKGAEYARLLGASHVPATHDFFVFFFVLTAFHLVHLLVGMAGLGYVRRISREPLLGVRESRNVAVAATYWHYVDLLWLPIFAALYLVR
jgi:nitric oxide reductase NorE protein